MPKILIITGDGGEAYETWFAVHRFQEAGYETRRRGAVEAAAAPGDARFRARMGHLQGRPRLRDRVGPDVRGGEGRRLRRGALHRRACAGVPAQRSRGC